MKASVFIGTSVDGFIARANGDLDWLPAGGGEPHGYNEFIASVDTIVIGRKTFETILTFEAWPPIASSTTLSAFLIGSLLERLCIPV